MFQSPFSFDGRIGRTEYFISIVLYAIAYSFVIFYIEENSDGAVVGLVLIPLLWFLWAQGAKRCHDVNTSGWMQIVPLYVLWMLFQAGKPGVNEYGEDPKGAPALMPVPISTIVNETIRQSPISVHVPEKQSPASPPAIPTNHTTILEILNINYSLVQDVLKNLRNLDLTNHLSYEFMDTTAKITINHQNSSQALLEKLYTVMVNIEVLGVGEGSLKIKLK